mgnify:CR=1 FL=1
MDNNNQVRILPRVWISLILFGLIGQVAWTIENMYLNVYIYKTVTYDPDAIAYMVAASAIVATVATLLMGALSDRLRKRKIFMTYGYILWGISIVLFGFITVENVAKVFPMFNAITTAVVLIIILDCIMTYIGSTSNDAAFQAWVTDVTHPTNRGKAEGVLATMPLLSMLLVFGFLDIFTQKQMWLTFFAIVGIIVFIAGVVGLFLVKDGEIKGKDSDYLKDIIYGFKPSIIKANKELYIVYTIICILGIAQQVFLPYFIIYMEYYLGIKNYALVLGAVLILASAISIVGGRLVDKYGKQKFLIASLVFYSLGMFVLFILGRTIPDYRTATIILTTIFGTIMMGAYLVSMVIFNSLGRDIVPKDYIGAFTGIRMIFFVMIPMIIGPFIGSSIIQSNPNVFLDEFGATQYVPIPEIFFGGTIVSLLAFIPGYYILKFMKKREGYYEST